MKSTLQGKREKKVKAWGILNAFGEFWTPRAFPEEKQAYDYMKNWQSEFKDPPNMTRHKIVPVVITLPKVAPKTGKRK